MPTAPPCCCPCGGRIPSGGCCDRCGAGRRQSRQHYDRHRGSAASRGYGPRWVRFRAAFLAEHPLCSGPFSECEAAGRVTAAVVVDHREPHRGDMVKFWAGPFDSMCERCHNIKTAKGL